MGPMDLYDLHDFRITRVPITLVVLFLLIKLN